jgi:nucleoside-diphosphate-sugar epimerase
MIKSRIILTGATGKTGSVVVAELLKAGYPVRTMARREDGRSAQLKEKGRLMKLFKIVALPERLRTRRAVNACWPQRGHFIWRALPPKRRGKKFAV